MRRIRTIALVHESLSREPGDDVTFIEIVRPLLRLAEEGLQSPDRPVRFTVRGDGGRIPATIATPLSVVLTELLQNAVDHGFPEGSAGGGVVVRLENGDTRLAIQVVDDGRGVAPSFKLDDATGLGLSIVRTLVTTELNGIDRDAPGDLRRPPRRRTRGVQGGPRHRRRPRRADRNRLATTGRLDVDPRRFSQLALRWAGEQLRLVAGVDSSHGSRALNCASCELVEAA